MPQIVWPQACESAQASIVTTQGGGAARNFYNDARNNLQRKNHRSVRYSAMRLKYVRGSGPMMLTSLMNALFRSGASTPAALANPCRGPTTSWKVAPHFRHFCQP
jgi:hypothetical protein